MRLVVMASFISVIISKRDKGDEWLLSDESDSSTTAGR